MGSPDGPGSPLFRFSRRDIRLPDMSRDELSAYICSVDCSELVFLELANRRQTLGTNQGDPPSILRFIPPATDAAFALIAKRDVPAFTFVPQKTIRFLRSTHFKGSLFHQSLFSLFDFRLFSVKASAIADKDNAISPRRHTIEFFSPSG